MAYEIEYKLSGGDPHVHRVGIRFSTCDEALAAFNRFVGALMDHDKQAGMELKILWVELDEPRLPLADAES